MNRPATASIDASRIERWAPAAFVVLWSTGFPLGRYATKDSGALTFLTVRLAIAAVLLWILATVINERPIEAQVARWTALAAMGLHVAYLGGVWLAIAWGLPSGLGALIAGLHPVLTSIGARVFLGEHLSRRQWYGVGLGFAGVAFVVVERLSQHVGGLGRSALIAMGIAVIGMSAGTLTQRARGTSMPLVRGTAVQYAASALVLAVPAGVNEQFHMHWTARLVWSYAYAVVVLSIGSILLLMWLLARQAAAQVTSLFFLTPALSAIEGRLAFGEHLGVLTVVGMGIALTGVALATRSRSQPS